ncbi:MAG: hypothetical protein ABH878_03830 [bacterium]
MSVLVLLIAGYSQADEPEDNLRVNDYLRSGNIMGLGLQPLGLFDPSRMSFAHSYTMSYMTSGGQGIMRGLFMETIGYRLSSPLFLTLNLGYLHQPYSSFGPDGVFQSGSFVGGAALDWHPSDKMHFRVEVANYPSLGVNPYSPYGYYPSFGGYNSPLFPNSKANSQDNPSGE